MLQSAIAQNFIFESGYACVVNLTIILQSFLSFATVINLWYMLSQFCRARHCYDWSSDLKVFSRFDVKDDKNDRIGWNFISKSISYVVAKKQSSQLNISRSAV